MQLWSGQLLTHAAPGGWIHADECGDKVAPQKCNKRTNICRLEICRHGACWLPKWISFSLSLSWRNDFSDSSWGAQLTSIHLKQIKDDVRNVSLTTNPELKTGHRFCFGCRRSDAGSWNLVPQRKNPKTEGQANVPDPKTLFKKVLTETERPLRTYYKC